MVLYQEENPGSFEEAEVEGSVDFVVHPSYEERANSFLPGRKAAAETAEKSISRMQSHAGLKSRVWENTGGQSDTAARPWANTEKCKHLGINS